MNLADAQAGFLDAEEAALSRRFLDDGHVVLPVADRPALDRLRDEIARLAAAHLGAAEPEDGDAFLNGIHHQVTAEALNALRLAVINGINAPAWSRQAYFSLARRALECLVGNELAMQRRLNLSIQMPSDASALLAVHADVWDGDSPFEAVVWLPLVDSYRTKSMFLLSPEAERRHEADFARFQDKSTDDLFRAVEDDLVWLDVPYGSVLLFNQNLMHGNVVNAEAESRWSMNCRFKSLFSPYAGKRLGEFFEPITIRAASRVGMSYEMPGGFVE
ncbi:MAG: hypothetical protein QF893_23215 [Alphaproteobacteria bacterium]|jgi:sporadic carbohydrate cluster 2OG-Fe(II) oxygenase|nr:hypothetical protein [Alphaproteobacteria bacterium]